MQIQQLPINFLKYFKKLLMKVPVYLSSYLVDETRLYWKRMQDQSYISKKEKLMPGYKTAKDSLNLLFDGNASSDMKLKPVSLSFRKAKSP